jgi:ribosomal protein S18
LNPASESTNREVIISQGDAKAQGLTRFYTGKPCVRGHDAPRFVSSKACVICARENQTKWDVRNPDKLRQYVTDYDKANREQRKHAAREYRKINPESANEATRRYRKRNPGILNAHCSARRARQLSATPTWVNVRDFEPIYTQAKEMSYKTGVSYQVDHIVPLKHELVCGLHVPWNLQIIPAADNQRKKNYYAVV